MRHLLIATFLLTISNVSAQEPKTALRIAFGSYRDRAKHPHLFFYDHDGVANGKMAGTIPTPRSVATAEAHPWLTHDGKFCASTFELENKTGKIDLWDLSEKKRVDLPKLNDSPNAQLSPSLSADGQLICFSALNRPMGPGPGYQVFLYNRGAKGLVELPGLNGPTVESRMPKISADGRFIVFVSNRKGGAGLSDVYLYDRKTAQLVELPGLNSPATDVEPSLSGDGNLIAFASDRMGGKGSRDIYLYDRQAKKLLDLPGLNGGGPEYTPYLSPTGRYLTFVSERIHGEGERDIYLYDRKAGKLLPTPGLNSKTEDFDPFVMEWTGE